MPVHWQAQMHRAQAPNIRQMQHKSGKSLFLCTFKLYYKQICKPADSAQIQQTAVGEKEMRWILNQNSIDVHSDLKSPCLKILDLLRNHIFCGIYTGSLTLSGFNTKDPVARGPNFSGRTSKINSYRLGKKCIICNGKGLKIDQ